MTAKSDYQSRQLIRRGVRAGAKVIVTGCYSQIMPHEIRKMEGVMDIVDSNTKLSIINMLAAKPASITFNHSGRSRPYLKVQDGCNFSCTYCIVPKARGRSRSLLVSEAINRARMFDENGYDEIVLTGIHLGSYGHDLIPKTNLSYLVRKLLRETSIHRIRLSSLEINEVDDELIDLLQDKRLCKHLHIPLQSGDDTILRLMNRTYTSGRYVSVLEEIFKKVPDIAIGTDLIAGFPGEGETEFLNTRNFVDSLPITYMHIFPYSSRPGTPASQMSTHNTPYVKKERVNILRAININKKSAYMSLQIGKTLDVIVEGRCSDKTSVGTSSNYLKVTMPSNHCRKGAHMYVRISGIEGDALKGDLIERA